MMKTTKIWTPQNSVCDHNFDPDFLPMSSSPLPPQIQASVLAAPAPTLSQRQRQVWVREPEVLDWDRDWDWDWDRACYRRGASVESETLAIDGDGAGAGAGDAAGTLKEREYLGFDFISSSRNEDLDSLAPALL